MLKSTYLKYSPSLSGEEEVIARAGQGIDDPWAKEDQNPGILGIHPINEKGELTPQYRKLIEDLHMVDCKPAQAVKPSKFIEEINLTWKQIQERKKNEANIATERIKKQYILSDNQKLLALEKAREERELKKQIDKVVDKK